MKKEYKKPEVEIYELEIEDIITTSSQLTKSINNDKWDLDHPKNTWFDE